MTGAWLDPAQRTQRGIDNQSELLGTPAPEPRTLFEASWRDYVYAEVWSRQGLDRRSRLVISIASAACTGASPTILEGYVSGALTRGKLTLAEQRGATQTERATCRDREGQNV